MKQAHCEDCGQPFPLGDLFSVSGRTLCEKCGDAALARRTTAVKPGEVTRLADPTICGRCNADQGARELTTILGVPVCDTCAYELRHRPFPTWIKLSMAGLLALAVAAFAYNSRFFFGYMEMRGALRAAKAGDLGRAAALMSAAAAHVPEERQLKNIAELYTGLDLLANDKCAEAAKSLHDCLPHVPPGERATFERYELQAEAGAAFDAKNYNEFMLKEAEMLRRSPNDPFALAGMASAYACKYATTGDATHKDQALHYLDLAAKQNGGPDVQEFRQRILFRLHTREIINQKEFHRRYPNGWKEEGSK